MVIGCIAPFSGPYAPVGQIVSAGLLAASGHIHRDLGGTVSGYRPVIVTADAPLTPADGQKAYAALAAKHVDAILWCGSQGLAETLPAIVGDLTPVIAIGTDLQGRASLDQQVPDLGTSAAAGFPVFQTSVPDGAAIDLLVRYAAADRGFQRAALVWSTNSSPGADAAFGAACQRHGIANVGTPGYDSSAGPPDLSATANALRATGAQAVVVVGSAAEASALATLLDQAGARYVDTPTAKARFAPMLLGVPGATASVLFNRLAGTHAARGTSAASTLGAVVGLPGAALRDWVRRFVPGYNGGLPQGGEGAPADAVAALLAAAAAARSTAGADVVAALELGTSVQFASPVPLAFAPDRHLAVVADDLCVQTVEYEPQPAYNLGVEWSTVFPTGYRAPDLLVDFTLAANRRAHPALVTQVVNERYGISSQASYQDANPAKIAACHAVH
jgi:hypothetical protein